MQAIRIPFTRESKDAFGRSKMTYYSSHDGEAYDPVASVDQDVFPSFSLKHAIGGDDRQYSKYS